MYYDDSKRRWWGSDLKGDEVAEKVFSTVQAIIDEQANARYLKNLEYVSKYENRSLSGLNPGEYWNVDGLFSPLNLNVIQSCVDTLASKIAVVKPKPMFLTVDGDFDEQMKAKGMQRFVMGNFHASGLYKKAQHCFLDAGICDIGSIKIIEKNGKIDYERVFPNELIVDEQAALSSDPRELFQRKFIAVDVLAAMFPDFKKDIFQASTPNLLSSKLVSVELIEVIECWHLPSGPESEDGKHAIVVKGKTLVDESWEEDDFPFAFLRWTRRPRGFFGQGLAEQLSGIQEEIRVLVQKIQAAHNLLGVPWVISPLGSKVKNDHITNEIGIILEHEGMVPPTVQVHQTIHPEIYNHLNFLYEKAFEISGLSQLSATSRRPAGIESGIALRTLLDTESQRFALLVDAWQEFFLDVARQTIKLAKKLATDNDGLSVTWSKRDIAKKIKWSEVDLDEDRYVLQLWPVNLLPDTPAGKLAYVEQMITIGLLDPSQGQALLDFPDLEAFNRTNNASIDDINYVIDHMLATGEYLPPEMFENLSLAIKSMQGAWLRGRMNGWDERKLDLLSDWIKDAIKKSTSPAPPPGAMSGQPPEQPGMPLEQQGMPPEAMQQQQV